MAQLVAHLVWDQGAAGSSPAAPTNFQGMYYTYILYSNKIGKYYTGQTQDLQNRLKEHLSGEGKYSSLSHDWQLVWSQKCESRSEALKLETKIKKRGAKRFLVDKER